MGMKPRLDDANKKIDIGDAVSCSNYVSGEESNPNIPNTVTTHKTETNKKIVPNVQSGPKNAG